MKPDNSAALERRPLASRERRWSKVTAHALARMGASPNTISLAGMVCGVLAGAAFAATAQTHVAEVWFWLAGALLVQLRLLANMFDGMVAIETGVASRVGELFNEVPDRISDTATLIGLGYATRSDPVLGFIAACVALFVAYIRAMGKAAGAPQEFCGPMAKPQRMFAVTLGAVWCGLTPREWQTAAGLSIARIVLWIIILGGAVTALRRLTRIARRLRQN